MAEDNEQQSPFTRPGFVAATVVIALIGGQPTRDRHRQHDSRRSPTPPTSTSAEPTTAAPTSEPPEAAGNAMCLGLPSEC